MPAFVTKAIGWLVEAQHSDGGWGAGSHANQQLRDPHQVVTDPATTAFAATALLRAGNTPTQGDYRAAVVKAIEYLVSAVESAPDEGSKITNLTGTQPQSKLGPLVDTAMTAQFLARVRPLVPENHPLRKRVDVAVDKCLAKLKAAQQSNGSWGGGGWAPVLQTSFCCTAFELAQATGKRIDQAVLDRARNYQKENVNVATGRASADAAAGVELYSFSGAQRANAGDAGAAVHLVEQAKAEGKVERDAKVDDQSLRAAGVAPEKALALSRAFRQNEAQIQRLADEQLIAGFGNNGGEEYLSYLLTSESLAIAGGEQWQKWNSSMHTRLEKIQNSDGSWSGQHCITSPVFCTAAVVQCLTTDRDLPLLRNIVKVAAEMNMK